MKKLISLILLVASPFCMATPKRIEMIFLSPSKTSVLLRMIEQINFYNEIKKVAQADNMDGCQPMGDGCFHPQYGYIEKTPDVMKKPVLIGEDELKLKTINAIETNLINCDKGNYFDIYCGKSKGFNVVFDTEVWFDTSSSLKTVDYNRDPDQCKRREFLELVAKGCKGKVDFSIYNTSKKQVGEYSSACLAYGTNDEKRLLTWMKDSTSNRLLIVTDIDEMSQEMQQFLSANGAKTIGDGVKAFTADDLVKYATEFIKGCK